jgi:hypothetical protein
MCRGRFFVAMLAIAGLALPGVAQAQTQDQANGTGVIAGFQGAQTGTFDFTATSGPSGESPSGSFTFSLSPVGFPTRSFSGTVTCLAVSGNTATVGGQITQSEFPAVIFQIGDRIKFTVQDNGPNGQGDLFSVISVQAGPSDCVIDPLVSPIQSGDIVVVDASPPAPVPTSVDDCKNGGWRNYPHLGFKNQGDCVSWVRTNGRNPPDPR